MRKILFILFFLSIFQIDFAQSLVLRDFNGNIISGETINLSGDVDKSIVFKMKIYNTSSSPIDVRVRKQLKNQTYGSGNGLNLKFYYSSTASQLNGFTSLNPGKVDSSFYCDYHPNGNKGVTAIRYVFFSNSNKNDSTWVDVVYEAVSTSIEDATERVLKFSNPYPNPSNGVARFNYEFSKEITNPFIEIYDLIGNKVLVQTITDQIGVLELNTSLMNNGIYFYSLVANDEKIVSRKMVVKH